MSARGTFFCREFSSLGASQRQQHKRSHFHSFFFMIEGRRHHLSATKIGKLLRGFSVLSASEPLSYEIQRGHPGLRAALFELRQVWMWIKHNVGTHCLQEVAYDNTLQGRACERWEGAGWGEVGWFPLALFPAHCQRFCSSLHSHYTLKNIFLPLFQCASELSLALYVEGYL